jgi:hypothetical protein
MHAMKSGNCNTPDRVNRRPLGILCNNLRNTYTESYSDHPAESRKENSLNEKLEKDVALFRAECTASSDLLAPFVNFASMMFMMPTPPTISDIPAIELMTIVKMF